MKIFIRVLKALLMLLTAIWGLFFNGLGAFALILHELPKMHSLGYTLLATTIICYIIATVLVMLNYTKISAGLSIVGTIIIFIIGSQFAAHGGTYEAFSENHFPSIFITIVTVLIAICSNLNIIDQYKQKKLARDTAAAPSILDKPVD